MRSNCEGFIPFDRARIAAEILLAAQMEHGTTGPLDIPASTFEPFALADTAAVIRGAVDAGNRGRGEVVAHALSETSDQKAQDAIRAKLAAISESCTPESIRPERLEFQAGIVRQYNAQQNARSRAHKFIESGEGAAELAEALAAIRPVCGCRGGLQSRKVDHAATLGLSWAEIDDLRPPYVIDGFVRQGELLLLGAESKSRKSWLAQDAGLCVATGAPWLADDAGQNGFAVNQARAWILDLELANTEAAFRFAKARGNRWPDDPRTQQTATGNFMSFSLDGLNACDIAPMIDELQTLAAPGDLVVVDCFYRLVPDGNETTEVALAMERLKRFAGDTGAAVIVVDHFRKAGDDKARNRFNGSFVKQAAAATLVAIESKPGDVLEMNIDARTFHGCPKVHCRFNLETYAFQRVPEADIAAARDASTAAESQAWIAAVWQHRALDSTARAADTATKWGISRPGAVKRLGKLTERGFLVEIDNGSGHAKGWKLTETGAESARSALNLKP